MLWLNIPRKQLLRLLIILLVLLAGVLFYSTIISTADDGPYYFSDTSQPQAALTFEVTWGEGNLKEILAILKDEKVKATFFVSGAWIENFPEKAKEILLQGHELGKYSFSSIPFTYLTEEDMTIEFENFNRLAAEILEYRPGVFRPPLGEYNEILLDVAKKMVTKLFFGQLIPVTWWPMTARRSSSGYRRNSIMEASSIFVPAATIPPLLYP